MSLNIELFERIKAHLREEPRRADTHYGLLSGTCNLLPSRRLELMPPCRTVGCIAGTAVALTEIDKYEQVLSSDNWRELRGKAICLLGMSDINYRLNNGSEGYSNDPALFQVESWPKDLRLRYTIADLGSVELVETICEAIDRFTADPEGF